MDKQKQIEEMAKIMDIDCGECYTCEYYESKGINCTCLLQARELYNAGYRKIPEDAVLLTGMETEQRFEDLMVAFDEMGFMPNTTHPFPEEYVETWKQRLIFVFNQLRKETAEKFAEKLKAKKITVAEQINGVVQANSETKQAILWSDIDEICKEITRGVK